MNIYEIIFILSTLGLVLFGLQCYCNQKQKKQKTIIKTTVFSWSNFSMVFGYDYIKDSITNFTESFSNDQGFLNGLINVFSSEAGITATWAHMVAGDIFATRWIWKKV